MQLLKTLGLVAGVALTLFSSSSPSVRGEQLREVSFEKPFEMINSDGVRVAGWNWNMGGATTVNRHFVRLTPDRQSKRGFLWSKKKIESKEFSIVFTFRISGQAASWFGDGLALWITTAQNHIDGDNHGFTGNFKGFGVLFDTFVNSEHSGGHQDVTLFVNDGSKSLDQLNDAPKVGCMAPGIRYYERNAAFSPSLNMSRAKIQYKDSYVAILIDAKNTGDWVHCYGSHVALPEGWVDDATIGITASTGGLADNHDVIALKVYDDVGDMAHEEVDQKVKNATLHDLDESLTTGDNEAKLRHLKRKYEQLIEDFEHQFTALKESTENTIKKLREQEAEDTKRIAELETWVSSKVSERVATTVDAIRDQVDERLTKTVQETAERSSGWKMPFFALVLVLGGVVAGAYKKYQDLRKSHLL
uniref:L-type lectin-like domain-containing protein n=1 Tax=Globisporangium ultimum (strain ATCC 200006 / CBS 805.95 / DAOM BR144) TaxID=431595 RepID=K3W778_GLOUD